MVILRQPAINWTWYLALELQPEGTVKVLGYDRWHNHHDGWEHPQAVGNIVRLHESERRTLLAVEWEVGGDHFSAPVSNPDHIFSYKWVGR